MKPVVILGVTGSVAAYRAADLARELMREGCDVRVCLTRSAEEFVTPALFEALTGNPCLTNVFDEPVKGRMAHIDWARDASLILVCPATANAIATIAHGNAEDMLTSIISASERQVVIAPAMNPQMYASSANQENMSILRKRGAHIVEPAEGDVACGESGQGKLAAISEIVAAAKATLYKSNLLKGKNVVITAGPTYEDLDPVRFIGNRSSGKMGFALAQAALQMGAKVTLVAGPTQLVAPPGAEVRNVRTAKEMLEATLDACAQADLLIGAAAVADYRPAQCSKEKIKGKEPMELRLEPNPDILAEVHTCFPKLPVVGFAAETSPSIQNATAKLASKGLKAIALNEVGREDIGFDSDANAVVLLFGSGEKLEIEKDSKFNVAVRILEALAKSLGY